MALFDTFSRSSKDLDKALIEKTKTKQTKTKSKQNGLLDRISNIRKIVMENLGQYRDDYIVLTCNDDIRRYVDKIIKDDICAIDTETTGLNIFHDKIVGISLYSKSNKPAYIPINHVSIVYFTKLENQADEDFLKTQFQRMINKNVKFLYHNGKFDLNILRRFLGFTMNCPYWDTLVCSYLINSDKNKRNLKDQYDKYCSYLEDKHKAGQLSHFSDLFDGIRFDYIPIGCGYIYAARDAYMTYKLFEYQWKFLHQKGYEDLFELYHKVEVPIVQVTAEMKWVGVSMDKALIQKYQKEYNDKLEDVNHRIEKFLEDNEEKITQYRVVHYKNKLSNPINIASNEQLAILLYDILGCKNENGDRGVDEESLSTIDNPLVNLVIEYRSIKKMLSTYIDSFLDKIDKFDERLHANFNQNGAETGRFSSSEPNLQNLPHNNIRNIIKATEGYYLVGADYSQQEPRILAHLCQDENMLKAYRDGKDIYATMASLAFHKSFEECCEFYPNGDTNEEGKQRRSKIKSVVLGLMYGRGMPSVARYLNITFEEAQQICNALFEAFPKIKEYMDALQTKVKKCGYTTSLWGRRRYLEHIQDERFEFSYLGNRPVNFDPRLDIDDFGSEKVDEAKVNYYTEKLLKAKRSSKNFIIKQAEAEGIKIVDNSGYIAESERQVVNSVVQGSAADMTKKAMVALFNNKELRDLGFRLLISVHDENIGECPKENIVRVRELLSQIMIEANDKCSVRMKCDAEVSECWYGPTIKIS